MRGVGLLPSGHVTEFIEGSGLAKVGCEYLYRVLLYKARVCEAFKYRETFTYNASNHFQNFVATAVRAINHN